MRISVDRQILSRLSGELAQGAARLEEEIYQLIGERINIGSPKQLGDILFGRMGLPGGSKTKTGQWATGARALEELAEQGHKLPQKILDWRQVSKLRSTYTDALPASSIRHQARPHSYALAATTTGRLSSSDPNLQNIPVRTAEDGKSGRPSSPTGQQADWPTTARSSCACSPVAGDTAAQAGFADGADIHAITASEMFNVPVKACPQNPPPRQGDQFRIIYGIRLWLANQLSIPRESRQLHQEIFRALPGIRDYIERPRPMPVSTASSKRSLAGASITRR